jgi:hypothetical protein
MESIKRFRDSLKSNPHLEAKETEWDDFLQLSSSSTKWMIDDLAKIGKIIVDPGHVDILKLSGVSAKWKNKKGNYFLYGGFVFNGIYEALANPSTFWKTDFSLAPDAAIPAKLKRFTKLNWFEKQSWGDDWRFGCFVRGAKKFPPKIAFFDRNWFTPLDLSFDGYLDALVASCAVKGWQYFYVDWDQEIPHQSIAVEDMKLAVKALPKLFPKQDFTHHSSKLDEVMKLKSL